MENSISRYSELLDDQNATQEDIDKVLDTFLARTRRLAEKPKKNADRLLKLKANLYDDLNYIQHRGAKAEEELEVLVNKFIGK